MISVQTNSAAGTAGSIDGLTIELTDGSTGTVNFEAVPEPVSVALVGVGVTILLTRRRLGNDF